MWSKGTIGIPDTMDKTKQKVCHYCIKHYEEPSQYGINKGRISKLTIKLDDQVVANYDRGWDIEPTCKEAEMALAILMKKYN